MAEGVCPDGPLTGFFLIDTYRRPVFFRKLQTIKKAVPWEDFRADICVPSCKDHAVAGQASKQPHSGTHLGTSAARRSLSPTQIAEGGYCSRFPTAHSPAYPNRPGADTSVATTAIKRALLAKLVMRCRCFNVTNSSDRHGRPIAITDQPA